MALYNKSYKKTAARLVVRHKNLSLFTGLCLCVAFLQWTPVLVWVESAVVGTLGAVLTAKDHLLSLVNPHFLYPEKAQLEKLKNDNRRLHNQLAHLYIVHKENRLLKRQLNTVQPHATQFVTAAVLTAPKHDQCFLIGAGEKHGLVKGQPVVTAGGVLGRVDVVSKETARVMPLTHVRSRIPVTHFTSHVHAILVGNGSAQPTLVYQKSPSKENTQGFWVTSSHGGVFTQGMPVGYLKAQPSHIFQAQQTFLMLAPLDRVHSVQVIVEKRHVDTAQ